MLLLSLGMIGFGISMYFTAFRGERWHYGMDFSFLNRWLSEKDALTLAYGGGLLLVITLGVIVIGTCIGLLPSFS